MQDIKLEKMTIEDYNHYIFSAITSYEAELLLSGRFDTKQAAHEFAVWEYDDIFKNGFSTSDTYLYNISANGQNVGSIWFLNEDKLGVPGEAFIGDFLINQAHRKKGYGYQALLMVEKLAKEQGLIEMRLGVMNHNTNAKKLYARAGYKVFKERDHDCVMRKFLA